MYVSGIFLSELFACMANWGELQKNAKKLTFIFYFQFFFLSLQSNIKILHYGYITINN